MLNTSVYNSMDRIRINKSFYVCLWEATCFKRFTNLLNKNIKRGADLGIKLYKKRIKIYISSKRMFEKSVEQ
jgi:hypothetical protein